MEKAFHDSGWMSMEATYSADGPDGSDLGYSRVNTIHMYGFGIPEDQVSLNIND
jgi:hypothetical protein